MKTGTELITAERQRQIDVEGWTPDLDDALVNGELAKAGTCYALYATGAGLDRNLWPWSWHQWNPQDSISNLVRAGALIAAEIDRLQRLDSQH